MSENANENPFNTINIVTYALSWYYNKEVKHRSRKKWKCKEKSQNSF